MSDSARKAAYRLCAEAIDAYFKSFPETTADVLVEALHVRDSLEQAGQTLGMEVILTVSRGFITKGENQ